MCISVNKNFAALQYGQESDPVFTFSLWYLAPRSLALEVLKSPILLLLLLQLLHILKTHRQGHRVAKLPNSPRPLP